MLVIVIESEIDIYHQMLKCNKSNKYKLKGVSYMKAKTVIYGAYFALKLWIWRAYTKYIKKQGKRRESEQISN